MDVDDLEDFRPTIPALELSSEQRSVLGDLCLYHQNGLSSDSLTVKWLSVILFLAISAGLVLFANRLDPYFCTFLFGFLVGILFTVSTKPWYRLAFQRHWPLLERIVDWKVADRTRRESDILGDQDASPPVQMD